MPFFFLIDKEGDKTSCYFVDRRIGQREKQIAITINTILTYLANFFWILLNM